MPAAARRIALYRAALRWHARAARGTQAVIDGLALGALDRQALGQMDETFYADSRELVDGHALTYHDERSVRQGLYGWESAAVEEAFPPGGRVIVTAAGAGREVLALCQNGFDAWGFEPHADLVAAGEQTLSRLGYPGRLRVSVRDAWPADAGRADAVVLGWSSYMLIPGRDRRIALLRAARAALAPGAPLLASFTTRPSARARDLRVVARVAATVRRLRGDEPIEYGDWLVGDARSPLYVHLFSEPEVRAEMREAGFSVEKYATIPYGHVVGRVAG